MRCTHFVIGIVILTSSCQSQQEASKSSLSNPIKGDWAAAPPQAPGRYNRAFFSFDDSTCFSLRSWDDRLPYHMKNDTLIIEDTAAARKQQSNGRYVILRVDNDSLILSALQTETQPADTIRLHRLRAKNNLTPSSISFASGMCFGTCPSMALTIDSQRNILFFGDRNAGMSGGYRGTISQADYASILGSIRQLPLDSLKTYYKAPWTDDQTVGLMIQQGDKTIRAAAYGFYGEPIELRILLNRLMAQYKQSSLQRDSTITHAWFETHPDTVNAVWRLLEPAGVDADTMKKLPPPPAN